MPSQEACSTMLISSQGELTGSEIKSSLEKGDIQAKITTIKKMISMQLNGEPMQSYIMLVMKFCSQEDEHTLKKLLLYFWEVVDMRDENGNPLPEMIMLCASLRADLQHANEYVRGMTLRFLCKLKERDLFEPLVSAVVKNLTDRVSYVRRNAVLAIHTIYANCPDLIPDAPETIDKFIMSENDVSARRNGFNMLVQCAQDRAVRFLTIFRENNDMSEAGDVFQLAMIEFIRSMIHATPYERSKYIPLIFSAMQSKNPAVSYQCAVTLLRLSSSPTAIKHAAQAFTALLISHSDSNVRLIVLDRLRDVRREHLQVLQELIMEVARGLNTGNMDLRIQILTFSLSLVSSKTIEAYVQFLKAELVRSQAEPDGQSEIHQHYRQQVVKAIHTSVMRHIHMAPSIMPIMLDYICEPGASSYEVVTFVREVMQKLPELREDLLDKLVAIFPMISPPAVIGAVLWLFGVHCQSISQVTTIVSLIKECLNPFPLAPLGCSVVNADGSGDAPKQITTTTVREDGTYMMNVTYTDTKASEKAELTGIRSHIVAADWFLAGTTANTLAKLVVKANRCQGSNHLKAQLRDQSIEIMHELVKYGTSCHAPTMIDNDSHERIRLAITVAQNPNNDFLLMIVDDSYNAYKKVQSLAAKGNEDEVVKDDDKFTRADQPLVFTLLQHHDEGISGTLAAAADDVLAAVTNETIEKDGANFMSKLHRVKSLSGFNDPVYVEATVTVHQYDVLIEWYVLNQTNDTLTNLSIEIATIGDMKICDRPVYLVLEPHHSSKFKTSLKVSSTETGVIYGCCLFDSPGNERQCVVMNEIHIDIMDYIHPATCNIADFRAMWLIYEWENKIVVSTDFTNLREFVERVMAVTNMSPIDALPEADEDDCSYLSCSLYAKSVFGEDALANISLELNERGTIEGVVRVRSKTQAIALGLGDKVSTKQKRAALDHTPVGAGIAGGAAAVADLSRILKNIDSTTSKKRILVE